MDNLLENQFCKLDSEIDNFDRECPLVLSRDMLELSDSRLNTDDIVIRKGTSDYGEGSITVASAIVYANKQSFRALGLALLAHLFDNEHELVVSLRSADTEINRIKLDLSKNMAIAPYGLKSEAVMFEYFPNSVSEYPFAETEISNNELPHLAFCNTRVDGVSQADLRVCGNHQSIANLAQLLIDFSQPMNEQPDIQLQNRFGIMGVSDGSAELVLVLPEAEEWW